MAFGIGPSMGAMGNAARMAGSKFTGQPAQSQQFGQMGPDARSTMGTMPPANQQNMMAPQGFQGGMGQQNGMQQGIGPSNIQELLRKFMMGQQQPMQGGIMGQNNMGQMPQGLSMNYGG